MRFCKELFRETLLSGGAELDLKIDPVTLEKMEEFAALVVAENEKQNLTRLVQPEEMAIKHFLDSLSCLLLPWPQTLRCLDLGTGAGFPGIPLALIRPKWSFLLLDSLAKRVKFLEAVVGKLEIGNVKLLHGRGEDVGQNSAFRGRYDLVVSRAVAGLPVLLELGAPLLKIEGQLVAFKAREGLQELKYSNRALKELKLKLEQIFPFDLPQQRGQRNLFVFKKKEPTPSEYPRRAGIPLKMPLR